MTFIFRFLFLAVYHLIWRKPIFSDCHIPQSPTNVAIFTTKFETCLRQNFEEIEDRKTKKGLESNSQMYRLNTTYVFNSTLIGV